MAGSSTGGGGGGSGVGGGGSVTGGTGGPYVRQVAYFSRMTVARIVDVSWTRPGGERIAMVTERGTVHLLDMPPNAFAWPPPRRRRPGLQKVSSSGPAAEQQGSSTSTAVSIASSAFGAALEIARPLMARPRKGSVNMAVSGLSGGGANLVDSANLGGRAIAATISNSLGKTGHAISQLRHTGENRVSLPYSSRTPSGGWPCASWMSGCRFPVLVVIGDGLVRLIVPRPRRRSAKRTHATVGRPDKSRTPKGSKYRDFFVPALPDSSVSARARNFIEIGGLADEDLDFTDRDLDMGAGNLDTIPAPPAMTGHVYNHPHALSRNDEGYALEAIPQAEIEFSAPYQPFYTDRRVAIFEYVHVPAQDLRPKSDVWAFGQVIPAVQVSAAALRGLEERQSLGSAMQKVKSASGTIEEEIVVTTRRRRRAGGPRREEDGFFEDDCEVLDFADQRV